jgi:hypothetical protein
MSTFTPIVVNTKTYNAVSSGNYTNAAVTFSSPTDSIKLSGGKLTGANRENTTAAAAKVWQTDVTVGSVVTRVTSQVRIILDISNSGVTPAQVQAALDDLYDHLTVANIGEMLKGRQ